MTHSSHSVELEEWECIRERREVAFDQPNTAENSNQRPQNLVGLALSGGGIRSALYNDGFLQGLSHRGFLRYVDYMSSVSGGGYIAGHLIAQSNGDKAIADRAIGKKERCFHDDAASPESDMHSGSKPNFQRWHLGRDPETGEVDPKRMAGIGGYLSRPSELLPAYLWSCFFSGSFYIGLCGIVATFSAMLWRSFDNPTFRTLYMEVLGIRIGDELLIAFIPFLLLFILYVFCEATVSVARMIRGYHRQFLRNVHSRIRSIALLALLLAFLTSIAIFLGNGTTNIHANASGAIYLNRYAQSLALIAGTMQLLVFFGSDRLFRSERPEAKSWQKHLQNFIAISISLLIVFSMVHWMGRENISKFTDHRDPFLLRGDISDWDTVSQVMSTSASPTPRATQVFSKSFEKSPTISSHLPTFLKPESSWTEGLTGRRLEVFSSIDQVRDLEPSTNPLQNLSASYQQPWLMGKRILGAFYAYGFAMSGVQYPSEKVFPNEDASKLSERDAHEYIQGQGGDRESVYNVVKRSYIALQFLAAYQDALVKEWNLRIASPEFTSEIIARLRGKQTEGMQESDKVIKAITFVDPSPNNWLMRDPPDAKPKSFLIGEELTKLLDGKSSPLTENQRKSVLEAIRRISLFEVTGTSKAEYEKLTDGKLNQRREYAIVNRMLLETLFPAAIKSIDIPSTYVVPLHDHRARCSWLGFWLVFTLIGSLAGVFRYQLATVFRFYRKQLGTNFLRQTHDANSVASRKSMYELRPTADGMPYPLMLAANLEPATLNGSYKVRALPFVFSPLYCGDESNPKNLVSSLQISMKKGNRGKAISLGDAVTLSGAAVSPLMTNNRCLSVLVDFFNTGLGTLLYRTDRPGDRTKQAEQAGGESSGAYFVVAGVALAFGIACFMLIGQLKFFFIAFAVAGLIGASLIFELGTPHFLHMLFAPREMTSTKTKSRLPMSFYVADGGFCDYLGVSSLLRRRCELIVVSDAGANIGDEHLGTLAKMCEKASAEMGIRFLDLDHEAPIDFGRLQYNEQRLVHQPYLCMRVRYPDAREGLLIYCQMAITENDPIEIKQIRYKFPSFPDEPTVNQFYTDDQVAAYRSLGYHIANKVCRELERWSFDCDWNPENQSPVCRAAKSKALEPNSQGNTDTNNPLQKFSESLRSSRCALESNSVPYFDVIQERLLTAYRLACYEEISYNKDDIFSEAVWPISHYAFPKFGFHVDQLAEQAKEPESFPSVWLRTYELSGDIRSVYRTAVVADINAMSIGNESFSERLWAEFLSRAKNQSLNAEHELFAAHLVVMATACQEIHRGRPHAAFQIGGRRKLIELCKCIATKLQPYFADAGDSSSQDLQLRQKLDEIVAELTELERSIFQGGEHVTTISFAQCLAVMWGRMSRGTHSLSDVAQVAARARVIFDKKSGAGQTESRMVEARYELDQGLRKTNMHKVIEAMTKLWYLGYFGAEGKDALNSNPIPSFAFNGFGELVGSLSVASTRIAADDWLRFYKSNGDLGAAYRNAVRLDIESMDFDGDCYTNDLFRVLVDRAKSLHPNLSPARLLPAHLAAIAVGCYEVGGDGSPLDFSRAGLSKWCESLPMRTHQAKGKDDQRLESGLTALVGRLMDFKLGIKNWTPNCSAHFAKCCTSFWGRMMRRERSINETDFELGDAKSCFPVPKVGAETNDLHDLQHLFETRSRDEIVRRLKKIWYTAYLSKDDEEQYFLAADITQSATAASTDEADSSKFQKNKASVK